MCRETWETGNETVLAGSLLSGPLCLSSGILFSELFLQDLLFRLCGGLGCSLFLCSHGLLGGIRITGWVTEGLSYLFEYLVPQGMLGRVVLPAMCESVSGSVVSDSCHSMEGSPPGSPVHGILQTRVLEWDAISSSSIVTMERAISYWSF